MQAKADARAEKAAKIISLASLLLLFVAVALYTGLSIIGWNAYIAAAALFSAGLAGYPLLTLLTHAVASQTSRSFTRLGSYDRYRICLAKLSAMMLNASISAEVHSLQVAYCQTTGTRMVHGTFCFRAHLPTLIHLLQGYGQRQTSSWLHLCVLQAAVRIQGLSMLLLKDWTRLVSCASSRQLRGGHL